MPLISMYSDFVNIYYHIIRNRILKQSYSLYNVITITELKMLIT